MLSDQLSLQRHIGALLVFRITIGLGAVAFMVPWWPRRGRRLAVAWLDVADSTVWLGGS